MILGGNDVDAEIAGGIGLVELLDVGRTRCRHHCFALEVVDRVQLAGFLRNEPAGREVVGVGEGDLLLTLDIIGGRAALEIDGAVRQQRNARRRGDRIELHFELVELQLLLHRIDDAITDVHGEADRLLVVVEIGKRNRRIAIADGDGAGFLDVLQRSGELLRHGGACAQSAGQGNGHHFSDVWIIFHLSLLLSELSND